MQINRLSSGVNTAQQSRDVPRPASTAHSATEAVPARADLQSKLTPSSNAYLLRLQKYGNLEQKTLASAAFIAIKESLFMDNPVIEPSVCQFGVAAKLGQFNGMLLANCEKVGEHGLELLALGFCDDRFYEDDSQRGIKTIVLAHAPTPPENKPSQGPGLSAHALLRPAPDKPSDSEVAKARAEFKEDIEALNKKSMHQQKVEYLTSQAPNKYLCLTAPIAHARVLPSTIKKLAKDAGERAVEFAPKGLQSKLSSAPPPIVGTLPPPPSAPSALPIPKGPHYEFEPRMFREFRDDRWLADPKNQPKDAKPVDKGKAPALDQPHAVDAHESPSRSSYSSTTHGAEAMQHQLEQQTAASVSNPRYAQIVTDQTATALQHKLRREQVVTEDMAAQLQDALAPHKAPMPSEQAPDLANTFDEDDEDDPLAMALERFSVDSSKS
jgi:hypothetical protein